MLALGWLALWYEKMKPSKNHVTTSDTSVIFLISPKHELPLVMSRVRLKVNIIHLLKERKIMKENVFWVFTFELVILPLTTFINVRFVRPLVVFWYLKVLHIDNEDDLIGS